VFLCAVMLKRDTRTKGGAKPWRMRTEVVWGSSVSSSCIIRSSIKTGGKDNTTATRR